MTYLQTQYTELLKQAETTSSRKEAIKLINKATIIQEMIAQEYRNCYSGIN